jgi:ABC-type multidrug transport system ATPase subunit
VNHSQRNLKKLIRAKEDSIADEELFLSAAYQKYQTSLARAVTGRYRYGLQVLLDWDISEQAGVAYTDNYKVHLNAANPITQSFPTRFLRSQSLTGLTGHEVGHLLYSDFTAHAVHLRSLENGSFYPKEPELSLPAYQTALEEIKEVLEEKDKAGCLTLARCAATFQNILEDIHIEDRMCEEFHGTFRQGIELNNLRMSEQIPSIQEQIDKEYQPFSIIANLILSYCRTGNINNPTGYQGDYLDTISDCTDLLDTAMESEKGTDRMLVSNALLALTWNYIQPLIEKTREELEMHGEDSAADALEDLLGDEVSSGAPLPTGKSGAIPKNIKPASPKGSGNDEGNAPSGPRTKEDAIEEAKQVLGRNGAGKTTCLKMISGLARPTAGEIEMFGCKGKELERIRSRVGCLIEAPGLYGNMNAYTNLKIKCELFGIRKKGYIEDILETVGLEGVGKKKTKHFSLGMKQRLGIGLALVGEPDLLVLDEPINGLDPQGIAEVRDTIQRLRDERNMTILISSHILEELSKIATDYGIIHNGSLLQELTSEELMKRCSERIEIELIHPEQAVPILDRMGFTNYQVTDKSHIHIFERLNESANVNMELAKAGILVNGISITSEELETYFLNLTGGNQNA